MAGRRRRRRLGWRCRCGEETRRDETGTRRGERSPGGGGGGWVGESVRGRGSRGAVAVLAFGCVARCECVQRAGWRACRAVP